MPRGEQPTSRSLKHLRKTGWCCCVVEKNVTIPPRGNEPGRSFKRDAFGFGDVLAAHKDEGVALVQTTSAANMSSRIKKILAEPMALAWLSAGGLIIVHGWGRRGPDKRWAVRVQRILQEDFAGGPVTAADVLMIGKAKKKKLEAVGQGRLFFC